MDLTFLKEGADKLWGFIANPPTEVGIALTHYGACLGKSALECTQQLGTTLFDVVKNIL